MGSRVPGGEREEVGGLLGNPWLKVSDKVRAQNTCTLDGRESDGVGWRLGSAIPDLYGLAVGLLRLLMWSCTQGTLAG